MYIRNCIYVYTSRALRIYVSAPMVLPMQKTEIFFKNTTHYTTFPDFFPLFTHKQAEKVS